MKLISLNAWGGQAFGPLMEFVRAASRDTDIFCFQEVRSASEATVSRGSRLNLVQELSAILPDHEMFFEPIQDNIDEEGKIDIPTTFGQVMFIRKSLPPISEHGLVFTFRGRNAMHNDDFEELGSGFQYAKLTDGRGPLTILSVHGIPRPGDKLDTPSRIEQSRKIREFSDSLPGRKIICGDFNLAPETESVRILERGMKNLIADFHISSTRSSLNFAKYPDDATPQRFADYVFVSPDVDVVSFDVPDLAISDHLPLIFTLS